MRAMALGMMAMLTLAGRLMAADPTPFTYELDLAGGDTTISVQAGQDFQFKTIDEIPGTVYTPTLQIDNVDITPLDSPFKVPAGGAPGGLAAELIVTGTDPCDTPRQALDQGLKAATSEAAVKTAISANPAPAGCSFRSLIDTTRGAIQHSNLKLGQMLTYTVSRGPLTGEQSGKTWTFKLTTGPRGAWLLHYGFSFFGNRDRKYFAAAIPGSQKFTITPEAKRNNLEYMPSFTFSYLTAAAQRRSWAIAPTAGLGTDLSNVTAFLGASLIVGENVNAYVGLAAAKQQRLNGQYHAGDVVETTLTEDQLNDKVYVPTIVFGVGFRFSSNPFNSGSGTQPAATTPAAPAKPPAS